MSLKPLIAKLARLEAEPREDALAEGRPSQTRQNLAADGVRKGGRASADIFHATDVALDLTLSLAELRKLLAGQDVKLEARDRKKISNQSNVYRVTLRYRPQGADQ